jgi:hypothetical protein
MSQSAVVRDYRALEVGRRRTNRLVLTVAGYRDSPVSHTFPPPVGTAIESNPFGFPAAEA